MFTLKYNTLVIKNCLDFMFSGRLRKPYSAYLVVIEVEITYDIILEVTLMMTNVELMMFKFVKTVFYFTSEKYKEAIKYLLLSPSSHHGIDKILPYLPSMILQLFLNLNAAL